MIKADNSDTDTDTDTDFDFDFDFDSDSDFVTGCQVLEDDWRKINIGSDCCRRRETVR